MGGSSYIKSGSLEETEEIPVKVQIEQPEVKEEEEVKTEGEEE